MQIDITPELEEMIRKLIAEGVFSSAEEAVRCGLARLILSREPEEHSEEETRWLREEIAKGVEDIKAGRVGDWDMEEMWRASDPSGEHGGEE